MLRKLCILLSLATLAACKYSEPVWIASFENIAVKPHTHVFAVVTHAYLMRWPDNFVAQFPDGGSAKIVEERAYVYICDADAHSATLRTVIRKPSEILSGFDAWILGWHNDDLYVRLRGHAGKTSDTPVIERRFKLDAAGNQQQVPEANLSVGAASEFRETPNDGLFVSKGGNDIAVTFKLMGPYQKIFDLQQTGEIQPVSALRAPAE